MNYPLNPNGSPSRNVPAYKATPPSGATVAYLERRNGTIDSNTFGLICSV